MILDPEHIVESTAAMVEAGEMHADDRRQVLDFARFLREIPTAPRPTCPGCGSANRDERREIGMGPSGEPCTDAWHDAKPVPEAWHPYCRGQGPPPPHALSECQTYLYEIWTESWMKSGRRQEGEEIECVCGRRFVHICDEAEGCYWGVAEERPTEVVEDPAPDQGGPE